MNGLEALFEGMGGGEAHKLKPISVSELDKGFEPIANLKPGDKVRAKSDRYNNYKPCKNGTVIVVFRTGIFPDNGKGSSLDVNDFTALFGDESCVVEFAFDSRRFERVIE